MDYELRERVRRGPLLSAGILIGVGMGGFVDGILFHQILQIHNMLSNHLFPDTLVAMEINMVWDGLFHAFTWATTMIGIVLLWRAGGRPEVPWLTRSFVGSLFAGWGLFNFVEGVIDHHILRVHHVVERASGRTQVLFDLAFLASGGCSWLSGLRWFVSIGPRVSAADRLTHTRDACGARVVLGSTTMLRSPESDRGPRTFSAPTHRFTNAVACTVGPIRCNSALAGLRPTTAVGPQHRQYRGGDR